MKRERVSDVPDSFHSGDCQISLDIPSNPHPSFIQPLISSLGDNYANQIHHRKSVTGHVG
jgi:hypothetical protein